MAREGDTDDHAYLSYGQSAAASPSATSDQSGVPPRHRDGDARSDTASSTAGGPRQHHRQNAGSKQHHVSRTGTRVHSSKALHKLGQQQSNSKPSRRVTSPTQSQPGSQANLASHGAKTHKRVHSEGRLVRNTSAPKLPKSSSQVSLKRNRSLGEVAKRKSLEGGRPSSGGTKQQQSSHRPKPSKSTVQFALGDEEDDEDEDEDEDDHESTGEYQDEDEWVDASGSNSPHVSRKGSVSVVNNSGPPSQRPSRSNSRPTTPAEQERPEAPHQKTAIQDQERNQHKEYLTSRLLQRVPSSGAIPPKMTSETARATPRNSSPESTLGGVTLTNNGSHGEEVTSRFVDTPGSGMASQGSFYHLPTAAAAAAATATSSSGHGHGHNSHGSADLTSRRNSMTNFHRSQDSVEGVSMTEPDNSALVPRGRRHQGRAGETSRIQQKLNLQRASSVMEPGSGGVGVGVGVGVQGSVLANPLIGVGGPGYDGGQSRDPRVSKLLERTGMEYLVVRRYQNSIARSLNRLSYLPENRSMGISRSSTSFASHTAPKRSTEAPLHRQHTRNASMPNPRPVTPTPSVAAAAAASANAAARRSTPLAVNGGGGTTVASSLDDDNESRNERTSGSSTAGEEEEDGTAALLRNMWDKTVELSASN